MKVAIFGAGVMGEAFATHLGKKQEVFLYDKNPEKASLVAKKCSGSVLQSPEEVAKTCLVILLAIKPKDIEKVAKELAPFLKKEHILISILAGTSIALLEKEFPHCKIVRVMPNLPLVCGEGVLGVVETEWNVKETISQLFVGMGLLVWIPEAQVDAISSLTGSGPAFIFVIIEAMVESAIAMGIAPSVARDLVLQTILGSVKLLSSTGKHPAELKWMIASPGGTTIVGLKELEDAKVRSGIINTFLATYHKNQTFRK